MKFCYATEQQGNASENATGTFFGKESLHYGGEFCYISSGSLTGLGYSLTFGLVNFIGPILPVRDLTEAFSGEG